MFYFEDMHCYQGMGASKLLVEDNHALWAGLGLGKTVMSLTAVSDLFDAFESQRCLIIAPLRVANTVWHKEILNWEHLRHLTYSIVTGSVKQRMTALHKTAQIYITNRESIPWLVELYGEDWPFDTVIIDEASSFKSHDSVRFLAMSLVLHKIRFLKELTATPGLLTHLWAQMNLLDGGKALGSTIGHFRARWFEKDFSGYKYIAKKHAKRQIYQRIRPLVTTMRTSDYLEMPDLIKTIERVTLSPKLMKVYREFEKEFVLEVKKLTKERGYGAVIEAVNSGVLTGKLMQFANGANYTDEHHNWVKVHSLKIDCLKELVEENDSENIMVAYNYKSDLARLQKAFPKAVVMDREGLAVDPWNEGKIKMLLVHPASAGFGLNLQYGGSFMVWFGLTWSYEMYSQLVARLHRQGQGMPVRVVHIVAEDTIDERIVQVLAERERDHDELMEETVDRDIIQEAILALAA